MKPRARFFQDDAGPYKGFAMHASSAKGAMFSPVRIGNQSQKEAPICSELIGAHTCYEMEAGSF